MALDLGPLALAGNAYARAETTIPTGRRLQGGCGASGDFAASGAVGIKPSIDFRLVPSFNNPGAALASGCGALVPLIGTVIKHLDKVAEYYKRQLEKLRLAFRLIKDAINRFKSLVELIRCFLQAIGQEHLVDPIIEGFHELDRLVNSPVLDQVIDDILDLAKKTLKTCQDVIDFLCGALGAAADKIGRPKFDRNPNPSLWDTSTCEANDLFHPQSCSQVTNDWITIPVRAYTVPSTAHRTYPRLPR